MFTEKPSLPALGLLLLALAFYAAACALPMWGFYLVSPQYPHGLELAIYLNRVGGDTSEVNILNHYIGMAHLDTAAAFARAVAVYALIGIAAVSFFSRFANGKLRLVFTLPSLGFPPGFLAGVYISMYNLGHHLNPSAPVHVAPFTPPLLGDGHIGNFHTVGLPGPGFYLILGAAVCVLLANYGGRFLPSYEQPIELPQFKHL